MPLFNTNEKIYYGYKKLIVWQKADELAFLVYVITKKFPKDEIFGLTSQLRRAALSVSTNLAEGAGRQNKKEFRQFVNIALGSITETEYLIDFSCRLNYMDKKNSEKLQLLRKDVSNLLWKLYQSFTSDLVS